MPCLLVGESAQAGARVQPAPEEEKPLGGLYRHHGPLLPLPPRLSEDDVRAR